MRSIIGPKVALAGLVVAFVLVVWAPPGSAAQHNKPESLSIDGVTWSSQAQAFEVHCSAVFGISVVGESAAFLLHTLLELADAAGQPIATLAQEDLVLAREGAPGAGDGMVALVPQLVPWVGWPTYAGELITVMARTEVRNAAGQRIAEEVIILHTSIPAP